MKKITLIIMEGAQFDQSSITHHPLLLLPKNNIINIISTIRTQIYLHVYYLSHKKSTNKTEESIYLSIHRLSNKSVIQKAINTRIYTYV